MTTTLPNWPLVSRYLCASTIWSKLKTRSITGF